MGVVHLVCVLYQDDLSLSLSLSLALSLYSEAEPDEELGHKETLAETLLRSLNSTSPSGSELVWFPGFLHVWLVRLGVSRDFPKFMKMFLSQQRYP